MRKFDNPFRNFAYLLYRLVRPFGDPIEFLTAVPRYMSFFKDMIVYSGREGAEKIKISEMYPILHEKTETTNYDLHYFYQDIWAFKKILASGVENHVDVGSRVDFVGFLTAITRVTFIDIRPLEAKLENFVSVKGSILSIPFSDDSVHSLSCLHVVEHIGLGRYGDPVDPLGTKKACRELSRVLARNGNFYFAVPVGKQRLCFNSHRIHSPTQICDYFNELTLVEFSGIGDDGQFLEKCDMSLLENADYACGLFHFNKS